jgi:hypothetical protein
MTVIHMLGHACPDMDFADESVEGRAQRQL